MINTKFLPVDIKILHFKSIKMGYNKDSTNKTKT